MAVQVPTTPGHDDRVQLSQHRRPSDFYDPIPAGNYKPLDWKCHCVLKVCQGRDDPLLVKAWEDWDEEHNSENDYRKEFPKNQNYVVFVLQHGSKDLESFVLLNFDEARSLLVQVTAALAMAESAFQFEHRDLQWENILLSRNETASLKFVLDGKDMSLKTFGLLVSIIDFTLSRINTGEDILFLDLFTDADLFKGPKGDKQAHSLKKNIGLFSGFMWVENEEKQKSKVKEKLDKCVKDKLLYFCDVLNIPVNKTSVKKGEELRKLYRLFNLSRRQERGVC